MSYKKFRTVFWFSSKFPKLISSTITSYIGKNRKLSHSSTDGLLLEGNEEILTATRAADAKPFL